ncbi:unnamed protein product [Callosobruchus maculatus]|uniref:Uncharacterized protein n=1 Tax=Callosobruchus maculatus TaxID=64391 RepID=A0A653C4D6_CALMS|nr:unnamed protein product [Callosobruchus maculatus]
MRNVALLFCHKHRCAIRYLYALFTVRI